MCRREGTTFALWNARVEPQETGNLEELSMLFYKQTSLCASKDRGKPWEKTYTLVKQKIAGKFQLNAFWKNAAEGRWILEHR